MSERNENERCADALKAMVRRTAILTKKLRTREALDVDDMEVLLISGFLVAASPVVVTATVEAPSRKCDAT